MTDYPPDFGDWAPDRKNEYFADVARNYRAQKGARSNGGGDQAHEPRTPSPLVIVSPATLDGAPPARKWIVRDWVPCGVLTGLYGDGGLGKSLLALQLQTATALGAAWLGLPAEATASLGVYCEDSYDELWRRQDDICASYQVDVTRSQLLTGFRASGRTICRCRSGVAASVSSRHSIVRLSWPRSI